MAKQNPLKKITARAKQIARTGKSWQQSIKQAGREYRAGKIGATLLIEKGETKRTKPRRVVQVSRTKAGTFKGTKRISGISNTDFNFWVKMFAPRSRKWQNDTYREIKSGLTSGRSNLFETRDSQISQLRALEYILNKKPLKLS